MEVSMRFRNVLYRGWYTVGRCRGFSEKGVSSVMRVLVARKHWINGSARRKRVFHAPDCGYLRQVEPSTVVTVKRSEAEERGLRPCQHCF